MPSLCQGPHGMANPAGLRQDSPRNSRLTTACLELHLVILGSDVEAEKVVALATVCSK